MATKRLRNGISMGIGLLILVLFVMALRPQPVLVDFATVLEGPMQVTVDEEARTRVRDPYVVSAPVMGRLLRVDIDSGDSVVGGDTVVARLLPTPPSALDLRTRGQAQGAVSAATAALAVARADQEKAQADLDLAQEQVRRFRELRTRNAVAKATLDQAEREVRAAAASVNVARAAIAMREAELQTAKAQLISFGEPGQVPSADPASDRVIPIIAPVSGQVLRVIQESETTMAAGAPILEVGDVTQDLEIIAELLSSDAVKVRPEQKVFIRNWGGTGDLLGRVERIEPWGFTKFSALGVEEQRVNAIIKFDSAKEDRTGLGHGYRVDVRVVVWEESKVLQVPTSALFRDGDQWAVFVDDDGVAKRTRVAIGQNNGRVASVTEGLAAGDRVVLYPSAELEAGDSLAERS